MFMQSKIAALKFKFNAHRLPLPFCHLAHGVAVEKRVLYAADSKAQPPRQNAKRVNMPVRGIAVKERPFRAAKRTPYPLSS